MVKVIKSDTFLADIGKYDASVIATNTYCSLGNGVQREIALNYPYADIDNKATRYADESKVGTILVSSRENEPTLILAFIIKGYEKKVTDQSYNGLIKCLKKINKEFNGKKISMPMLGCSRFDGNLEKDKVLFIIEKELTDCDVIVYDFFQKSRDEKQKEIRKKELKLKKENYKLYLEEVKKRKKLAEERFKRNGHARY